MVKCEEYMEETPFGYRNGKNKSNLIKPIIFILIVVVAAALLGVYLSRPKNSEVKNEVPVEKKVPSPTEKPPVDKSTVKIQVLNGTGTPGQAGLAVKALEDAGYSADNIKSSNADAYDNTVTTITARADFGGTANDIKTTLKPTFDNVTIDSSTLSDSSDFDIIVVTGGKLFVTATPAPSPTGSETPTPSDTPAPTDTPTPTPTP